MPTASAISRSVKAPLPLCSLQQGDASRALDLLQQARVIIARLVEQSPGNHQLSKDLAMFDDNIAKLEQISATGAEAAQPEQAVTR